MSLQDIVRAYTSNLRKSGRQEEQSELWGCIVLLSTNQILSITLSPVSVTARGLVDGGRGLSLRFPRFIRIRDDKRVENASTPEFIAQMWRAQEARGGGAAADAVDDGDLVDVEQEESEAASEDEEEV